jgi:hypothetical protein
VGALDQVARIDHLVDSDGPARGMRRLRVITGGGLEFDVLPDRCLDLGQAWFQGVPLAWVSSVGSVAPAFHEPEGRGFLRAFGGGLLATCGLDSFGPPANDEDGVVGMHGRVGQTPARLTRAESGREEIRIEGTVRQTAVFAENLVLRRRISAELGTNAIVIDDTVTNDGSESSPQMMLYHFNLGWPLLDAGAEFEVPGASASPRDADAQAGVGLEHEFGAPEPGFSEQVFLYDGTGGIARLTNRKLGLRLTLRFSESLPALFEWKMTATHHYVLGIEPANTPVIMGRPAARAAGQLPRLAPSESASYRLSVEVERI